MLPYSICIHYLGLRMKYGNLEVGNITQNLLSTTRPCSSIEFRNFFSTLQAKHFEICQLLHSSIYQVMQYFWVFILNSFSLLWNFFFFLKKTVSLLFSLFLPYRWVNQLRYFLVNLLCGFFVENCFFLLNNIVDLTWRT